MNPYDDLGPAEPTQTALCGPRTQDQRADAPPDAPGPFSAVSLSAAGEVSDGAEVARRPNGTFALGNPGGPGRPAGRPNLLGSVLKDDLVEAYHSRGGVKWLLSLPDRQQFIPLLLRVLPRELAEEVREEQPLKLSTIFALQAKRRAAAAEAAVNGCQR